MPSARNGLLLAVALLILGVVLVMVARSVNDDSSLDDEWFDFEHPQ